MTLTEFTHRPEFNNINERLLKIHNDKQLNSFNLFTVSSYNSYLENFHSDVISLLLDANERHKHRNLYFDIFIDYLICLGCHIDNNDYIDYEVEREQGKIDIWIKSATSKKSIIIENKINNAIDQLNQIDRYYEYAISSGFQVDAIIYLSLNGSYFSPITDNFDLNKKITNIPAFINSENDLYNGWLTKCHIKSNSEDSKSFIFQYSKLIKHLSQTGMDKEIKDEFYNIVNDGDGFHKAKSISNLLNGLGKYRADIFIDRIGKNHLPFKKAFRYKDHY